MIHPHPIALSRLASHTRTHANTDAPRCKPGTEQTSMGAINMHSIDVSCEVEADPAEGVRFSWTYNNTRNVSPVCLYLYNNIIIDVGGAEEAIANMICCLIHYLCVFERMRMSVCLRAIYILYTSHTYILYSICSTSCTFLMYINAHKYNRHGSVLQNTLHNPCPFAIQSASYHG